MVEQTTSHQYNDVLHFAGVWRADMRSSKEYECSLIDTCIYYLEMQKTRAKVDFVPCEYFRHSTSLGEYGYQTRARDECLGFAGGKEANLRFFPSP